MLLITEFTTERGETFTVLQLLKRLRNAIIQIDGILFEHQGRIETLEFDVEKLKDDVENIYDELLSIDIRLDTIDNRLYNIDTKIINIESNITSIETILNNHDADILELNTLVTNITTDLNDLQDIVDSIPIVSESPLNGYIKIDGVDIPVFTGGGIGGSGGGEIIASYNDYIDTEENSPTDPKNLIMSFDIPDYNKNIELSGMMAGQCNSQYPRGTINFYGYDEGNNEVLLLTLDTNGTNSRPYYRWQYIINLFGEGGGISLGVTANSDYENTNNNTSYNGPTISRKNITSNKIKRIDICVEYNDLPIQIFKLYPFNILISKHSDDVGDENGGSGGSDSTVYTTKLNTLTNDDLNTYKNIWTLPCPPSVIGENSRFEYDASYALSVEEIDKIYFQCNIMGGEMNLGEININSFEEDFIFMKINLIGGTRKINDTEYFTSSDIEVIISNSNTGATKTSRVLARLNSSRGGTGVIGVDDNIKFNMMFTGDEVADRNSTMARGVLKTFYDINELI